MKERIVGATVLVAAAVLIVPVFLDGPPAPEEQVTQRITLPGQQGEEGIRTVVLERDRSEPLPANPSAETSAETSTDTSADTSATPAAPETTATAPDVAEPAPAAASQDVTGDETSEGVASEESVPVPVADLTPEPTEPARPTPAAPTRSSASGMWAVQLGSFSNQANAERLAADLRQQGFAAFLSRLDTANGELHRVRVGPQKDRDSAEAMKTRLASAGQQGQVVTHP